jgi:hypothetical protein
MWLHLRRPQPIPRGKERKAIKLQSHYLKKV